MDVQDWTLLELYFIILHRIEFEYTLYRFLFYIRLAVLKLNPQFLELDIYQILELCGNVIVFA